MGNLDNLVETKEQTTTKINNPSKKSRCGNCSKRRGILTDCKYCSNKYCFSCIQLEIHNCSNIQNCRDISKSNLNIKLQSERTIAIKVAVI